MPPPELDTSNEKRKNTVGGEEGKIFKNHSNSTKNDQRILDEHIEAEISQGIDQLKSELKLLLVFNENVKKASNQIIKKATQAKVERIFQSVSSSLNMLHGKNKIKDNAEDIIIDDEPMTEEELKQKEEDIKVAT